MAKYRYLIPILALLASLCHAGPLAKPVAADDYYSTVVARCESKLDRGAPKCYDEVYSTHFLPQNHSLQCCKNYLKMDKENQDCWELLFEDRTASMSLDLNLARCKQLLEPGTTARDGTFDDCKSSLNKGAPGCWANVYFKHRLPRKDRAKCCFNLKEMDFLEPVCFAQLFDTPKSTLALRDSLNKCHGKSINS